MVYFQVCYKVSNVKLKNIRELTIFDIGATMILFVENLRLKKHRCKSNII